MIKNYDSWLNESVFQKEYEDLKKFFNSVNDAASKLGLTIYRSGRTDTLCDVRLGDDNTTNVISVEDMKEKEADLIFSNGSFSITFQWKNVKISGASKMTRFIPLMDATWEKKDDVFIFKGFRKAILDQDLRNAVQDEAALKNTDMTAIKIFKMLMAEKLFKELYVKEMWWESLVKKHIELIKSVKHEPQQLKKFEIEPLDISGLKKDLGDIKMDLSRVRGAISAKRYGV